MAFVLAVLKPVASSAGGTTASPEWWSPGLYPQSVSCCSSGMGLRLGVSSKFPGDVAAGPAITLDTCWSDSSPGMAHMFRG